MRQPIQVVIYTVRLNCASEWEYLMLRRRLPPEGIWQGASGGVEDREETAEAALRELKEETGLVPLKFEKIDHSFYFPLKGEYRHRFAPGVKKVLAVIFAAQIGPSQEPRLSEEHDQYQWCQFHQALSLLRWKEDQKSLEICQRIVESKWK